MYRHAKEISLVVVCILVEGSTGFFAIGLNDYGRIIKQSHITLDIYIIIVIIDAF